MAEEILGTKKSETLKKNTQLVGLNLFGVTALVSVTYNVWKDTISFVDKAVE